MANSGEMRFGGTRGGGVPRRRAAGVGCLLFRYGGSAGNGRRRGDGRDDHGCVFKCFAVRVCGAFPRVYRTAGTVQLYASTAQYSHRPGTEDAWVSRKGAATRRDPATPKKLPPDNTLIRAGL